MDNTVEHKEIVDTPFPNVRFDLHEDLNAEVLGSFLSRKGVNRGGADMGEIIRKAHPALVGYEELEVGERLTKVKEYIHGFYEEHKEELDKAVKDISGAWKEYAPQFFAEARKLFPYTKWPEGKYIGHLSVSPPCPRFLETKTFLVMYQPIDKAMRITAHEMLHFIFFEYVRQRYLPEMENTVQKQMEEKLDGKFKVPLWELSEIFNLIVLSGNEWGVGKANVSASNYEKLKELAPEVKKIWDESGHDIDEFFTKVEVITEE